jgi:curved DNA-binding protein CbpA
VTQERDPYVVLGVARDASDRKIREAYYARARKAHPDLVGKTGLDAMRALNEAWALLKDPNRRADYDAAHKGPAPKTDGGGAKSAAHGSGTKFSGQPTWTGAAGPPPGRPWGAVLEFGIYAGWSLGEIARRDRGYLMWLRDRAEARGFAADIDTLLTSAAGADERQQAAKGGRHRK